jgi:hypothetical protein
VGSFNLMQGERVSRTPDKINQICDGEHDNERTRVVCARMDVVIMDFLSLRECKFLSRPLGIWSAPSRQRVIHATKSQP